MVREDAHGKDGGLEVVFESIDPAEVVVVRSLLDAAGIRYLIRGEDRFDAFPGAFRGTVFSRKGRPAVFLVRRDDVEDARALLAPPEGE
jgi:hypothetical protein